MRCSSDRIGTGESGLLTESLDEESDQNANDRKECRDHRPLHPLDVVGYVFQGAFEMAECVLRMGTVVIDSARAIDFEWDWIRALYRVRGRAFRRNDERCGRADGLP